MAQRAPKMTPDGTKTGQDGSKLARSCPKIARTRLQDGPEMAPDSPRMALESMGNKRQIKVLDLGVHSEAKQAQDGAWSPSWPEMSPG